MRELRGRGSRLRRGISVALLFTCMGVLALAPPALARNAYVANLTANTISVFDTQTNQPVGSIPDPEGPWMVAVTPDGKTVYVANETHDSLSVVNPQTNQIVGAPIEVGDEPIFIAITPDGKTLYTANFQSDDISVVNTQTNQAGTPIPVGEEPEGIAITPDGKKAFVANGGSESVSVIDTQTNSVVDTIPAGDEPFAIAITPNGETVYVANGKSNDVTAINAKTDKVEVASIPTGGKTEPYGLAITPDGRYVYVLNLEAENAMVIDTQTNQFIGSPIPVGHYPEQMAITPDGKTAYVTSYLDSAVTAIDTQTRTVLSSTIPVGLGSGGISITPDQGPTASFTTPRARPGVPVSFSGAASSDPDGTVAAYGWAFGDGKSTSTATFGTSHTYASPGTYQASLTVTDNEGCAAALVFTGMTPFCNPSASGTKVQALTVAYPGVKLKCPKSAGPGGCKFALQAVTKKKKGKPETSVAKSKAKAGRSLVISLKPTKKYATKLATAKSVLVKETRTIGGATKMSVKKLKIVK